MFRIIKRSPWIALGAAGAWLFDPIQGPQRRSMVTTKATTMANTDLEACLHERFKRMKFPEPKGGGIVIVSYPFVLSVE